MTGLRGLKVQSNDAFAQVIQEGVPLCLSALKVQLDPLVSMFTELQTFSKRRVEKGRKNLPQAYILGNTTELSLLNVFVHHPYGLSVIEFRPFRLTL